MKQAGESLHHTQDKAISEFSVKADKHEDLGDCFKLLTNYSKWCPQMKYLRVFDINISGGLGVNIMHREAVKVYFERTVRGL